MAQHRHLSALSWPLLPQRFLANSVTTNQGHPAIYPYMILTGGARSLFLNEAAQKIYIRWYPPGDMFGRYGSGIETFGLSCEHGSYQEQPHNWYGSGRL